MSKIVTEHAEINGETDRLAAIEKLNLLHSQRAPEFDSIVQMAADLLDCPLSVVSIVDGEEQWFKAKNGLAINGTKRELSFCTHTISNDGPLIVKNAALDPRFSENPLVTNAPNIRFYAGVPISIDGIHKLGALAVIDTKPRNLNESQIEQLVQLGQIVEGLLRAFECSLEAKQAARDVAQKQLQVHKQDVLLKQVTHLSETGGWEMNFETEEVNWTAETKRIHEVPEDYVPTKEKSLSFYTPESKLKFQNVIESSVRAGGEWSDEFQMVTAKGKHIWVKGNGKIVYENNKAAAVIGAVRDITAEKHAEQILQQSERAARDASEELSTVLNNMDEGVTVYDENSNLILWNERYLEIYEKPIGEVKKGVPFAELIRLQKSRGGLKENFGANYDKIIDAVNQKRTETVEVHLNHGTVVSSTHAPMPHGGWVTTHSDVTERVRATDRIEYASLHDSLTGVANRNNFNKIYGNKIETVEAGVRELVVILVDIDRFKHVNDYFGHHAGDVVLKEVAQRLQRGVREEDLVARLGGDEFALILELKDGVGHDIIGQIIDRITHYMETPIQADGNLVKASLSIGVAVVDRKEIDLETILARADRALYKVKDNGRSHFQFYNEEIANEISTIRRNDVAVKSACEDSNLDLHYQPIVDLRDPSKFGFEALIRWNKEGEHYLNPSELVEAAERNGTIIEIGAWVIDAAIKQASQWQNSSWVAVNISPRQIGHGVLLNQVESALKRWNFPATRLELEVTETMLLQENDSSIDELHELKNLGINISLDDFGTGYASLTYLQRFPFDKIKIDKSFISGDQLNVHSPAIVRAVANLAADMNIQTTAEGIETNEQLNTMRANGCTYGQGYFIGKPEAVVSFDGQGLRRKLVA